MKLAKSSVVILVIQLAITSSIAAKYLYQRWTCPRVWTRTVVYDPELVMRGRYLAFHLTVDGCQSKPPFSGPQSELQGRGSQSVNRWNGTGSTPFFHARLEVRDNKLVASRIADNNNSSSNLMVGQAPGASCTNMMLDDLVNFYIPEHAANPPSGPGHEVWIQVTVPPKGPPRPLQLAVKDNGVWKPIEYR